MNFVKNTRIDQQQPLMIIIFQIPQSQPSNKFTVKNYYSIQPNFHTKAYIHIIKKLSYRKYTQCMNFVKYTNINKQQLIPGISNQFDVLGYIMTGFVANIKQQQLDIKNKSDFIF